MIKCYMFGSRVGGGMVALLIIDFGLGFVFGTDFYLELGLELEPSFTKNIIFKCFLSSMREILYHHIQY